MVEAGWLFGNEELSDAQVVLVEEGGVGAVSSEQRGEPAPKRMRTRASASDAAEGVTLPIHKAIVASASKFFKARLGAWQEEGGGGGEPCRVVLHVPAGQLELGRRLVRAMYEAAPGLGDLNAEEQLQLLRLADRYDAPTVLKAAAAALGINITVMSKKGLAWAAVQAAYPPNDSPRLPVLSLRPYAIDALQLLFGDLEAVWATADASEKRAQLLALPFAALKALLADERTRVASENTVWHTIEWWVDEHELDDDDERVWELLSLVRVARLTPHYARTVFCESALVEAHLDAPELGLAAMLPFVGDGTRLGLCDFDADTWRLPARPRSALAAAVELEWAPRLSQLEALVGSLPAAGAGHKYVNGSKGAVWQGWPLWLRVDCVRNASGGVTLGLYLKTKPPSSAAAALITWVCEAVAVEGGSGVEYGPSSGLYMSDGSSAWGSRDFFRLKKTGEGADGSAGAGPPTDWAGVEAALRTARLVHGDGAEAHVKLRCKVTKLQ